LLASLAPDAIVTQTHCEVCAVSPADLPIGDPRTVPGPPRWGAGGEAAFGPTRPHGGTTKLDRRQVVALDTGTVDGILAGFESVASVLGAADAGRSLVAGIRARLASLAHRTRALPGPRPSVACLEWIEPVFAMGNWGPELIALAGGACALGTAGAHSTTLPWQAVRDADPDVIVVAPCGFGLDRTLAEMPTLAAQPGWRDLRAVRAGRVYVADGNLYFNRSGPLLFDTPEILAEMLHPGAFAPAHEGAVWRRWP
jgi:iron complex transport system substrate-binding protein